MTALAAICLLVWLFAGYALGYSDRKFIERLWSDHERLMRKVRAERPLRLIRGGKA